MSIQQSDADRDQINPGKRSRAIYIVVFLAVVVLGANLFPDVHAVQVRAFGERPFGLPVEIVVCVFELVLMLPLPWFSLHAAVVAANLPVGGLNSPLAKLLGVDRSKPALRHSHNMMLLGFGYLLAIMIGWITFATVHGL